MEQTLGYRAVNRLDSGFVGSLGVLLISFRRSGVKLFDRGLELRLVRLVALGANTGDENPLGRRLDVGQSLATSSIQYSCGSTNPRFDIIKEDS